MVDFDVLSDKALQCQLRNAVHSNEPVSGFTHNFYKYPARFSPIFAKTLIYLFTDPNDLVIDPFMGGGTTLVEAIALGRRAIGADINKLSVFISKAKTSILLNSDLTAVFDWSLRIQDKLNLHLPPIRSKFWVDSGYQRNISGKSTWPIRKAIELILANVSSLKTTAQQRFARCALLKTGQWALDCTKKIPSADEFRNKFVNNILEMSKGALEYSEAARESDLKFTSKYARKVLCFNRSAIGIGDELVFKKIEKPSLILTSPPYPGVHVLYHRWQINGRKETPAPFWIVNHIDGFGPSYYTLGDRKSQKGNKEYFDGISLAFKSLRKICSENTKIVQLVGFSDRYSQLPRYLEVMEETGFKERKFEGIASHPDGRLWRSVPNRKWYAGHKGSLCTSQEVVLFHEIKK
jgi:hypothetical protein